MRNFLTGGDVARRFNIPYRSLSYLFECGKLDVDQFDTLGSRRIFKRSDLKKVKKALEKIRGRN